MRHRTALKRTLYIAGAMLAGLLAPGAMAPAATLTTLHTFIGPEISGMGNNPTGVVADAAGNLYGATDAGGRALFSGVLFKLAPDGTETVLREFGTRGDASIPLLDALGVLYGTVSGNDNPGIVFKQPLSGTYMSVHPFEDAGSGNLPSGPLIEDSAGNLYGTAGSGGIGSSGPNGGYGTIYELSPTGRQTTLYAFTGGPDGRSPDGGVVADSTGHFFGTAVFGGMADLGTVFKLEPSGRLKVLHSFTGGADGIYPIQPLVRDAANNLLGTTYGGGSGGGGVVFKVSPAGKETVLHAFGTGTDGRVPSSALVADQAGNLYGTTSYGGTYDQGTVFELSPAGAETILYEFTGKADGGFPIGRLVLAADGTIIGAAMHGGASGIGSVFKLTP